MGYGDWIISTADVKRVNEETGLPCKIGDGTRYYFEGQIHKNNPRIVDKDFSGKHVWVPNYPGSRPYIKEITRKRIVFNDGYKVSPGEIYFTEKELSFLPEVLPKEPFIVVEPNVKSQYGHTINKAWCDHYWDRVFNEDLPFVQLGDEIKPRTKHIRTKSFRSALAVLSKAALFVGTDGGLHHAAAAFGIPAVVIWTGFTSPKHLGYSSHINLHDGSEPCGTHDGKCLHCRKKAEAILPEMVIQAIRSELEKR